MVSHCLGYCSIVAESHHEQANLYTINYLIGDPVYSFRGLVHGHHNGKQTDMVLEQ